MARCFGCVPKAGYHHGQDLCSPVHQSDAGSKYAVKSTVSSHKVSVGDKDHSDLEMSLPLSEPRRKVSKPENNFGDTNTTFNVTLNSETGL